MMEQTLLLRSFMFLPAYNKKFIDKALASEADALILDMEDSVPSLNRQEARENIIACHKSGMLDKRDIFIRINEIGSRDFAEDVTQLCLHGIRGFVPPKIKTAEDIVFLDKLLEVMELKNGIEPGTIKLAPLIETASAVANINAIAFASKRLVALCFGGEDYLNDLDVVYAYQESAFILPRSVIVNAARAAGLLPIDTPYLKIADVEGFEMKCREAYRNGFGGCLILNPKQIQPANRAFSPDPEKVEYSRKIIEASRLADAEKQSGVAMLEGTMIGPPMKKCAQKVLEQDELINSVSVKKKG